MKVAATVRYPLASGFYLDFINLFIMLLPMMGTRR